MTFAPVNKILIIDDEEKLRGLLARIIRLEGFEVYEADSVKSALKKLQQLTPCILICDVKLPDGNGIELIKEIKSKYPAVEMIMLTAYGNLPDGIQAIKNGAFDYIMKGDDNNKIIPLIYRASEKLALSMRIIQLEQQLGRRHTFDSIIGQSKVLKQALSLAIKVAGTDTSVLLSGETGTGKEVFAQAIHSASLRSNKPYIAVNCSAFPKDLLESELFGHKAGAYTGAVKDKKGLFEEANHGTLFLDEIGEMQPELQAKLLRVLESGEFIRVGESQTTKVNVRILSASNRDLQVEIEKGTFRQDLFYRLSAFQIKLPALKERTSDIELLANHFLEKFALKMNKPVRHMHPDYLAALKAYHWPGNIRELKNVIERSVILSESEVLTPESLPFEVASGSSQNEIKNSSGINTLSEVEKMHIRKVLSYTNGNKTETARLLNIALTTLYRKLEEYKL